MAKLFVEQSIDLNLVNSYAFRNLALIHIGLDEKVEVYKAIDTAIALGFVQDYGTEILELQKSNCE